VTKIKFCGLTRDEDIVYANELLPDYIGFVFVPQSRRYISPEKARILKKKLDVNIFTVGVFSNENPEIIGQLLNDGTLDMAQLHGDENAEYIKCLRTFTNKPLMQAFKITRANDIELAKNSIADLVLLDASEGGSGKVFDWTLIKNFSRPFFLAGGLNIHNATDAVTELQPYAVDVSSGIESNGYKDKVKMHEFICAIVHEKGEK